MTEPSGTSPIAAAVIVDRGRVLLVRRRVPEGALLWQFPAGKVEPGETAGQAAVRETLEEAGLIVSATEVLGERIHPATGRHVIYVACELVSGTAHAASAGEVAAVEWCGRAHLAELVMSPIYEPVQRYLDTRLA